MQKMIKKTLIKLQSSVPSESRMFLKHMKLAILIITILLPALAVPISFAGNYELSFDLKVQNGLVNHEFHVSIPSSLCEYYNAKTFKIANYTDYSMLVTPDAVKPIAENIRNLTRDNPRSDQEFANSILSLVHQIPYADCDIMYPIETLVDNLGKCDTLSLLAASIMKAGGLDVVLLYYHEAHHMNVGVYLPYEPHTNWWWMPATGYEFDGKKYWIAECTPLADWKVGEMPPLVEGERPWVVTLENSEKTSPAQVSSKCFSSLQSSSISINLSKVNSEINDQGLNLTVYGSLTPAYPNQTIAVYFSEDGISYRADKTSTDQLGNYSFSWNLNSTGSHYVRTSWSGNANYSAADSEALTVFTGFPKSLFEFTAPGCYFTSASNFLLAMNEFRERIGVREFLDIQLSGTGVLLTGEFIMLRDKQNVSSIQTEEITIPEKEIVIRLRGQTRIIKIPEKKYLKIVNIPEGMQQSQLPDNFDQIVNNKFGLIIGNSLGQNYSVSVKGMNANDFTPKNKLNGTNTVFMNVSSSIKENMWYKVEAIMTEKEITASLRNVEGALLESIQIPYKNANTSSLVVLIADNTERSVAFKNLKVSPLGEAEQPTTQRVEGTGNGKEFLLLTVVVVLVTATSATLNYRKRKKQNSEKNKLMENGKITKT